MNINEELTTTMMTYKREKDRETNAKISKMNTSKQKKYDLKIGHGMEYKEFGGKINRVGTGNGNMVVKSSTQMEEGNGKLLTLLGDMKKEKEEVNKVLMPNLQTRK